MKADTTLDTSIEWKLSQKLVGTVKSYISTITYADYYIVANSMLQAAVAASSSIAQAVGKGAIAGQSTDWAYARGQLFVVKSLVATAAELGYAKAQHISIEADILAEKLQIRVETAQSREAEA